MTDTLNREPEPGAVERRFLPLAEGADLRAEGDGDLPTIRGVACPFESLSVELWRDFSTGLPVFEQFERGAFSAVLAKKPDVVALRDHDRSLLLGRTGSGTARVEETERALEYEVDPPDTTNGRDTVVLLRRGDLFGSSFAFIPNKIVYDETRKGKIVRSIQSVRLLEDVSVVTRAAYPRSRASARSLDDLRAELDAWRRGGDEAVEEEREARRQRRIRRLRLAVG